MTITDIKITLFKGDTLKAFASIIIENAFVVKNIKIIQGKNGLFISMPSLKSKNGEFRDIAHPINTEARNELEKLIFDKYNEALRAIDN